MALQRDEPREYQPLLLLKNVSYPTYQLHAFAGTGMDTPPEDVLKICVLETMKWLRQRFRAFELPEELHTPEPDDYEQLDLTQLQSFYVDMGYKLQVVWLAEQGIWTLQLTEPDLGTRPGAEGQGSQPVPGRLFETNVAYRLQADRVECGFRTVVHEPEGTGAGCEVFRLAFIKHLARNQKVGLWQTWRLIDDVHTLRPTDIKRFKKWIESPDRTLPAVVLSEYKQGESMPEVSCTLPGFPPVVAADLPLPSRLSQRSIEMVGDAPTVLPMDLSAIARYKMGYAQCFVLPFALREQYHAIVGPIGNGELQIIEPIKFGGKKTEYPYTSIKGRPNTVRKELNDELQNYSKGKPMTFGTCVFVPEAQELRRKEMINLHQSKEEMAASFADQMLLAEVRVQQIAGEHRGMLSDKDKQIERLKTQLGVAEDDKKTLLARIKEMESNSINRLDEKDKQIARLHSKMDRPKKSSEVAPWIEKWFADQLIFHEKAINMMDKVPTDEVDMPLLCDALEYLATEYRDFKMKQIDQSSHDTICSKKYGRPFLVVPTKGISIEMYPHDYKIKYQVGYKGNLVESILEYHLKVGKDPTNLLRIYFLYDGEKNLVVVGALPKHLKIKSYK